MAGRRHRWFSIRIPSSFEIGIGSGFHRNTHLIITKGIAREEKGGIRLHPDGMQLKLDNMNRFFISSFHIIFLLLPPTLRADALEEIITQVRPGNIVIIGETHQKPESPLFFKRLVDAAVDKYQCLSIGLEIDRKQQETIDDVMAGVAPVSTIKVPVVIDHPGYRQLLEQLAAIKQRAPCVRVEAIDADRDRDENMAKWLTGFPSDKPVLALLGGLHTLQKVDWMIKSARPAVAEILAKRGFRVKSYPQRWPPEECDTEVQRASNRFVSVSDSDALRILNESLTSLINAKPYRSTQGVVDGFVVWECSKNTS